MSGIYYTDLVSVLEAAGITVAVTGANAGWETRARSSGGFPAAPLAVFWHHTASKTSPANDLAYMIHGSPDAPVGNMLLDRDGIVWPVAAGASNCAGKGGPSACSRGTIPLDQGNTRGWQIEAANNGVGEPWPVEQIDAYFAASNALNARFGNRPDDILTHALGAGGSASGWTSRKIDPATAAAVEGPWRPASTNSSGTWSLADIRLEAIHRADQTPTPPIPGDDDMRAGPYLIQATGADGTPAGAVYATDGNMMTLRWLKTAEALEGYRWQATQVFGWKAPELAPGAPVMSVDTIAAFGVVIE